MGKAMFTVIGAMAELESALISERVKAGIGDAVQTRATYVSEDIDPQRAARVLPQLRTLFGTSAKGIER